MEDKTMTGVIFRVDKISHIESEIVAVFPSDSCREHTTGCYAHIGQHSRCSRKWYSTTRPATPEEYIDLKIELEHIGYTLSVKKRMNWVR